MLKKIIAILLITLPLSAFAGTLLKCEGVMTNSGYKYVGTYCMDLTALTFSALCLVATAHIAFNPVAVFFVFR